MASGMIALFAEKAKKPPWNWRHEENRIEGIFEKGICEAKACLTTTCGWLWPELRDSNANFSCAGLKDSALRSACPKSPFDRLVDGEASSPVHGHD